MRVPFPYTDRPVRQHRPAVVVAAGDIQAAHGLLWVLMVTSAENRHWQEDVPVSDLVKAGLPVPSVVRTAKIATIEVRDAEKIGTLPAKDRKKIAAAMSAILES
ncbi:MAG TPA: type II toxin-antitoxin system PemK/MazF family toxin [Magnetospirillaceae bacterium]